jgi:hypothetical protein
VADLAKTTEPIIPTDPKGVQALLERAQRGDESTLPVLRKILEMPKGVAALGGELAEQAERAFIRAMGGDDLTYREAVTRKLELLRAELLGENPTSVERLLVERAVACWLQVQDADIRYAQNQGKLNIKQADYNLRRMDAANRRYLAALKALALVRKLAVPVLQVNIAKRQVNVAAAVPPTV